MGADIFAVDRKLSRAVDRGKGMKLMPGDLDLLVSIGLIDIVAKAKALAAKERARCRNLKSTAEGDTGSRGTGSVTGASEAHTFKSSGTIPEADARAALRRVQEMLPPRSRH